MNNSAYDVTAERAAKGDRRAMGDIVRAYYEDVFHFCARRLDPQRAEDATQETFIIANKRIKTFRGESAFKTWLLGIAVNVCRNESKKQKPMFELQEWDCVHSTTGDELIAGEDVRRALAGLTDEHREVVVLHELVGLTYEECAVSLGVPEGTVKSRVHHAFKRMREVLEVEA